jgi:hypothetical protein
MWFGLTSVLPEQFHIGSFNLFDGTSIVLRMFLFLCCVACWAFLLSVFRFMFHVFPFYFSLSFDLMFCLLFFFLFFLLRDRLRLSASTLLLIT